MILVKVKLDVSKCKIIILQCYMLWWSSCLLMVQLKQSWQHCQPCIEWYSNLQILPDMNVTISGYIYN